MKKTLVKGDKASKDGYQMLIGRYQPFHDGHKWLIDFCLNEGDKVLICIRDMQPDDNNPLTAAQVEKSIRNHYWRYLTDGRVKTMIIPDIQSVTFGRSVGYDITELIPPDDISAISGTKIRNQNKNI
jgi:adenylylsulfate kinase